MNASVSELMRPLFKVLEAVRRCRTQEIERLRVVAEGSHGRSLRGSCARLDKELVVGVVTQASNVRGLR